MSKNLRKKKLAASARAVLGKNFDSIIHMCALEPGETWKDWFDPYGNKLRIFKNSCKITKSKIKPGVIHDIYAKSSFGNISRHSYWCCFVIGDCKDFFWFIGDDGILRNIVRFNGSWRVRPPILSGFKVIEKIGSIYNIDEPEMISIESVDGDSSNISTMYITPWPPEEEILEVLKENKIV